ncbi:SRPBCC domain-containing protein [Halorubellus salinus]|uniref:SRPBCC domain-containing protein n=1 Tax=Halorubellus salinus TaxID=755309 RepID=UPI001D081CE9|nr:SRPBCC domain-containing protein [Halorubellus salinus]
MKQLERGTEIDASPMAVWEVLVDFESYPEWNPFVTALSGERVEGERLRARIVPPEGRAMTFKPRVTDVVEGEHFGWLGRLFVPGLFDGHHEFLLEETEDGRTRFVQRESFSGVLVGLLLDEADVLAGFDAMNEALKQRVEHGAATVSSPNEMAR